jgi:hypothetical protein
MLTPALIGGLIAGVLTAIPFVSCLCCIWIIGGGFVAAYFLSKDSPVVLTTGDGAIVGVFAGIFGAVIDALVSIPFDAMMRDSKFINEAMQKMSEYTGELPDYVVNVLEQITSGEFSLSLFLLGLVFSMLIFAAFSALGGIIGISLFKKKPDQNTQGSIDAPQDTSHRQS